MSVAGAVFASPPASAIAASLLTLWRYKPKGILLIVTNYTGIMSDDKYEGL